MTNSTFWRSLFVSLALGAVVHPSLAADTPATAPSAVVTQATQALTDYQVQSGDTVFSIARRFGMKQSEVLALNGLSSPNALRAGKTIKVYAQATTTPSKTDATSAQPASSASGSTSGTASTSASPSKTTTSSPTPPAAPQPKAPTMASAPTVAPAAAATKAQVKVDANTPAVGDPNKVTDEPKIAPIYDLSSGTAKPLTHLVQPGDTLFKISRQYKISVDKLLKLNNMTSPSQLRAGKTLLVGEALQPAPASTTAPAANPATATTQTANQLPTTPVAPGEQNLATAPKPNPTQNLALVAQANALAKLVLADPTDLPPQVCHPEALSVGIKQFRFAQAQDGELVWSGFGDRYNPKYQIHIEARDALKKLVAAAKADKVTLTPTTIFRSAARHAAIIDYKRNSGQTPAQIYYTSSAPGYSEHHTGLAVDFSPNNASFAKTKAYSWLVKNASKYGWKQSHTEAYAQKTGTQAEAWHWRFEGEKGELKKVFAEATAAVCR